MADLQQLWRETWIAELGKHLAVELTGLLPADREVVAAGRELAIIVRRDDAPLRVAVTHDLPVPGDGVDLGAGAAAQILGELQDEVALHLGAAWPVSTEGTSLYASAEGLDGRIGLSFVPRSSNAGEHIDLAPFVPPRPPEGVRAAG